ncbi:MAG: hypothetical protein WBN57_07450 [Gammaproteobacteria bacterium]
MLKNKKIDDGDAACGNGGRYCLARSAFRGQLAWMLNQCGIVVDSQQRLQDNSGLAFWRGSRAVKGIRL